jgi:hypothetical protein
MKIKDKEFIRGIISSDFKKISNPDFMSETLEKIKVSEDNKITCSNSGDKIFLIPAKVYISLVILLSLITVIISWTQWGQISNVSHTIEILSGILLNPVIVSIMVSFSLLYLIDLYLMKGKTKFTKPTPR